MAFDLGLFTIKYSWLFSLTSLYIAYMMIDYIANKETSVKKDVFYHHILNGLFVILLSYKFSFILFRPSIIWENPLGLIYFSGGQKGIFIGIILFLIFIVWQFTLRKINTWPYWRLIVLGFVTFGVSYYIVQTIFSLLI